MRHAFTRLWKTQRKILWPCCWEDLHSHTNGWMKSLPPPPPSGISLGIKLRHKKRRRSSGRSFMRRLQLTNATVKSRWRLTKSCPHCGPQSVESIKHMFYNCPPAQQGWQYAANIIWQLFANKKNLGPRKYFSMMQCLFDQPMCKILNRFNHIWFFLGKGLPWIIWRQRIDLVFNNLQWPIEKTRQIIWDTL